MSNPTRYTSPDYRMILKSIEGEYVLFEDYKLIETELSKLREELALVRQARDNYTQMANEFIKEHDAKLQVANELIESVSTRLNFILDLKVEKYLLGLDKPTEFARSEAKGRMTWDLKDEARLALDSIVKWKASRV